MTEREALKLALEALEDSEDQLAKPYSTDVRRAIAAIKEALREHAMYEVQRLGQEIQPEPPQRTWVGLTDEEIFETHKQVDSMQYLTFGKAIEAKLKQKNGYDS